MSGVYLSMVKIYKKVFETFHKEEAKAKIEELKNLGINAISLTISDGSGLIMVLANNEK